MQIKDRFCKQIADELEIFKCEMLGKSTQEIFGSSYKIELYVLLYECLMENVRSMSDRTLAFFMQRAQGTVLKMLYDSWLLSKDDAYDEIEKFILEEVA